MSDIARSRPSLYAHELFFGGYLLITFLRLVLTGQLGTDALIYCLGLIGAWALRWYDQKANTVASLRWRLLFYPVAMCVYFQQMRTAIPAITPGKYDAVLRGVDRALMGDTPSVLWQNFATPLLTELMSLCYLLFFPYLLLGVAVQFMGPIGRCTSFTAGLFSLYGIGFLGYTLVPATGPYLAFSDAFSVPLGAGPVAAWNSALVHMGSTGVDVFPSLHVAVSLFILGFDFQHNRRRFWMFFAPCMGLCCSTLYLRYHYLADVICGALLAGCALWIANRYNSSNRNPTWN